MTAAVQLLSVFGAKRQAKAKAAARPAPGAAAAAAVPLVLQPPPAPPEGEITEEMRSFTPAEVCVSKLSPSQSQRKFGQKLELPRYQISEEMLRFTPAQRRP